jgi:hypothetical protein
MNNLKRNKIMEYLKCTKCGEEAHTFKEFANGKCRFCDGKLEEETGDESTARDMGMDSEL